MQDKEIIVQWSESAPYWEKYRPAIVGMFAPVAQALIEDARIERGSSVLDVATGPGEPALTIAEVVGPDGRVVGTDVAPEMVEAARRETVQRKLQNARFEVAFTESLPFADNTFDSVVSRFGVMFFPSPVECLRSMLRVLKPGGRIALAVWYLSERNPFDYLVAQVVNRYVEPTAPKPGAPDMFRFAKPGDLLGLLRHAGAIDASERVLQFEIRVSMSAEDFWTLRSEMSEKLRTKLATLSAPQRAALDREAIESIRDYSSENGISIPAEVLIVSGAKQAS
ncbi:MAG TPA: methyltransferase domain-containing protein [Candidatus Acidoferrales bacterium]|nr:methyltransferase domain-containing protein [Candidatus Acidoferrales bacterium]